MFGSLSDTKLMHSNGLQMNCAKDTGDSSPNQMLQIPPATGEEGERWGGGGEVGRGGGESNGTHARL